MICRDLRARGITLPIIAYTGSPDTELKQIGFSDVLLKGASLDALKSIFMRYKLGEYSL